MAPTSRRRLQLSAEDRARLRRLMGTHVEHSGRLEYDVDRRRWKIAEARRGSRFGAPVLGDDDGGASFGQTARRATPQILFHTHVQTCARGSPTCAFAPPSRRDLVLSARRFQPGVVQAVFAPCPKHRQRRRPSTRGSKGRRSTTSKAASKAPACCAIYVWWLTCVPTRERLGALVQRLRHLQRTSPDPEAAAFRRAYLRIVNDRRGGSCFHMMYYGCARLR